MTLKEFKPAYFVIEERLPIVIATVTKCSLCDEDNIEQFGVELNQLIEGFGGHWLVLDLQSVAHITSSAVGKLIAMHRSLHRCDGRLELCGINAVIRNIFETAKLIDYFHVSENVDRAIELLLLDISHQHVSHIGKAR